MGVSTVWGGRVGAAGGVECWRRATGGKVGAKVCRLRWSGCRARGVGLGRICRRSSEGATMADGGGSRWEAGEANKPTGASARAWTGRVVQA